MRIRVEFTQKEKRSIESIIRKTATIMEAEELIENTEVVDEVIDKLNEKNVQVSGVATSTVDGRFSGLDIKLDVSENYAVSVLNACRKLVSPMVQLTSWYKKLIEKVMPDFKKEVMESEVEYHLFWKDFDNKALFIGELIDEKIIEQLPETNSDDHPKVIYLGDKANYGAIGTIEMVAAEIGAEVKYGYDFTTACNEFLKEFNNENAEGALY